MRTQILHEDKEVLVCYKPAGIPTQTKQALQMDVESELKNYLKGKPVYVVHRLDQPVEGILVFAKTKEVAAILSKQLGSDEMNKEYRAVVSGHMEQKQGILTNYIKKEAKGNLSKVVKETDQEAKYAELAYEVVGEYELSSEGTNSSLDQDIKEEYNGFSLVKIRLKTGRHHQIRVQLAAANHPLLGDQKYADEKTLELSRQKGIRNVALCAAKLQFTHPTTKEKMEFDITPKGLPFRLFNEEVGKN